MAYKERDTQTSPEIRGKKEYRNLGDRDLYTQILHNAEGRVHYLPSGKLGHVSVQTTVTGRSPESTFIVQDEITRNDVNWQIFKSMETAKNDEIRKQVLEHLSSQTLFIQDGFVRTGRYERKGVRVISTKAWHALAARSFFIPRKEGEIFKPEMTVIDDPEFKLDARFNVPKGVYVSRDFSRNEALIIGTEYGGEIKKSVFSMLNFQLPKEGKLPLHASSVRMKDGTVLVLLGLSGTGKTTLSMVENGCQLIGDDEHVIDRYGIANIENGIYAKTDNINPEHEAIIYSAMFQFGAIQENVYHDPKTGNPDYSNSSKNDHNGRAVIPMRHVQNSDPRGVADHPQEFIFLTADASGVLPPIARLDLEEQIAKMFVIGYTSKTPGTEVGVTEPTPTFSACFGAPFMPLPPRVYAQMLINYVKSHRAEVYMLNTGWSGGPYGVGKRMSLELSRDLRDGIAHGIFNQTPMRKDEIFGFQVPLMFGKWTPFLNPQRTWKNSSEYERKARDLAARFDATHKKNSC